MREILFSIIVVSLNAGEKLIKTVESIESQTCRDFEVIVKDGISSDGSVEALRKMLDGCEDDFRDTFTVRSEKDCGIYDGMNQAAALASGRYLYFLNCGDCFYDNTVLEELKKAVEANDHDGPAVFYGDIYDESRKTVVSSNPNIDGFACYRNVPCHQACFYDRELFDERGYDLKYRVRGDYEHFLWCFYEKKARMKYVPVVIAGYEGGGYSESEAGMAYSDEEHREIVKKYMSVWERMRYRAALVLTLAPLRTRMAGSRTFSGFYNRLKSFLYHR